MEQIRALNEVISMITDHVQFTSFVHHVNLPPKKKLPLLEYCVNFMREWMQISYKWTYLDHARRLKGCEHKHKGKAHDKDIPHPYIVCHLVEEVTIFIACYPRKVEVMISSSSF